MFREGREGIITDRRRSRRDEEVVNAGDRDGKEDRLMYAYAYDTGSSSINGVII